MITVVGLNDQLQFFGGKMKTNKNWKTDELTKQIKE